MVITTTSADSDCFERNTIDALNVGKEPEASSLLGKANQTTTGLLS